MPTPTTPTMTTTTTKTMTRTTTTRTTTTIEAAIGIEFMSMRSQKTPGPPPSYTAGQNAVPSVVLVTAHLDGTVRLFSPSGELLISFAAGHEQSVTHLAISPTHEEPLIATGDAGGSIRVHKVNLRPRRKPTAKAEKSKRKQAFDERISQYLGSQVNVTVQLHHQVQLPPRSSGEASKLTALAIA
ncbi:unnamed protein product [Polarella glacialis]|uniref:Uncharacterized protein n=1 Tax=Polarella glacialis TaxID=89957 RepID=A0A813GEQ0_POLGL|nr:unnamed protein product [Polarella glacialis]